MSSSQPQEKKRTDFGEFRKEPCQREQSEQHGYGPAAATGAYMACLALKRIGKNEAKHTTTSESTADTGRALRQICLIANIIPVGTRER
jgi:hypothetical protein